MQRFSLRLGPISMAIALGGGVLLIPETAAAQSSDGITGGFILSYSLGARPAFGIGLDVRYSHYVTTGEEPQSGYDWYMFPNHAVAGAFLQATYLLDGSIRFATGGHGGYLPANKIVNLDGEIGFTFRTSVPKAPGGVGLHLGVLPAFTLILAEHGPSFRGSIGLTGKAGNELILGWDTRGPGPCVFTECSNFFGSGRPLRTSEDASPELAPLVLGPPRCLSQHHHNEIDAPIREQLAAFWLRETSAECASIPAFLALARDLARAGAPSSLVMNARRAANEEATHTRLCAELAGEYTGLDVGSVLPPVPQRIATDHRALLERLAIESFWDGCVGEGAAAARARRLAAHARDTRTRDTLSIIARDEQTHADLAADVLRFCLFSGGQRIRDVLVENIKQRLAVEEKNHSAANGADKDDLQSFGRPNGSTEQLALAEALESSLALVM